MVRHEELKAVCKMLGYKSPNNGFRYTLEWPKSHQRDYLLRSVVMLHPSGEIFVGVIAMPTRFKESNGWDFKLKTNDPDMAMRFIKKHYEQGAKWHE